MDEDELRKRLNDELLVAMTEEMNRTSEWCPLCGATVEGLDLHLIANACAPRTTELRGILNDPGIHTRYVGPDDPRGGEEHG